MLDVSHRLSCFFLFVRHERDMHQSHWCHSRRPTNADTLDGGCISVLECRSNTLCCWQRGWLSDQRSCFLYFSSLPFSHICFHFCLLSFEVFSCAPHLNGELAALHECVHGQKSRPGYSTHSSSLFSAGGKCTFLVDKRGISSSL